MSGTERQALRLRRLWAEGRTAFGVIATIPSPAVARLLATGGLDWLIVDLEHGPIDHPSAHAMILALSGTGCTPLVRVAANEGWMAKAPLDYGAQGINFPMISDAAGAERAARALRYPPHGDRLWGPFHAPSAWSRSMPDYMAAADEQAICMITIEHADAVARIDEIMAVPGIDCAVIGIGDLATSVGLKGQLDHPEVRDLVAKAEAGILRSGIPLGGAARLPGQATAMVERGYRLLALGFDVTLLQRGLEAGLAGLPR
ncbi:MAG: putative aldolase [Enterovirga sp.]|nr:putative aldolase [Enterovirga sp.]